MCNCIFIGCFCVVFHCNTYELYRPLSIQILIHIGLIPLSLVKEEHCISTLKALKRSLMVMILKTYHD